MKMLIVDSREKPKAVKTILKQFESAGVPYMVSKLMVGDYMDFNRPGIIVDRKQSIQELAANCTRDHERFRRELDRAKAVGTHLVILVEQNRYKDGDDYIRVGEISDLMLWSSPHTKIRGEKVFRVLASWCAKYDIEVQFCDKRSTGKRILQIIYPELLEV